MHPAIWEQFLTWLRARGLEMALIGNEDGLPTYAVVLGPAALAHPDQEKEIRHGD